MGGGIGGLYTKFFFGDEPEITTSGAFSDLDRLGGEFSSFLMERLETSAGDTEQYRLGTSAIRDSMSNMATKGRQALGDKASTGGALDSGALQSSLLGVDSAASSAEVGQMNQLFLSLEDRRSKGVLPYLTGAASENLDIQTINANSQLIQDQMAIEQHAAARNFVMDLLGAFTNVPSQSGDPGEGKTSGGSDVGGNARGFGGLGNVFGSTGGQSFSVERT